MNEAYEKGRKANQFAKACREKYVSEEELKKALRQVNKKNREIRESFRITPDVMNFICY